MTWAAVSLGLSSLALAAYPLVRPFFPFDPTTPAEALAGASRAVTSPRWLVAHYLALIGFVLLLCVPPALHARLSAAGAPPSARRATLLSGTGIALILPTLGVELYVLPGIGRLFLEDNTAVAPLVRSIYLDGATLVMALGLVFLAVGAIMLATAIARSWSFPTWAGITFAVGLALGVRSFRLQSASSTAR